MTAHRHPLPELLEGSSAHAVHHGDRDALAACLDEVAQYGRGLWEQLRQVVDHLHEEARTLSSSWSTADWDRWEACYATSLDRLAGPRGDSGYGAEQAAVVRHGGEGETVDAGSDRLVSLRCPTCGSRAEALLEWHVEGQSPHPDVVEYRCPNGCRVDEETVRNIVGGL